MKKNIIFGIYLLLVIVVTAYIFKPDFATIFVTALICVLEVVAKVILSIDQADKKEAIWFKIVVLLIINAFACGSFWLANWMSHMSPELLKGDAPGLKMLFYSIPFSILGMDIYILYSYLFERKKENLI